MKKITKELNLLDVEDIENAISEEIGRDVKISEVCCKLCYCRPVIFDMPRGMYINFTIDDVKVDSFDLFWNDDEDEYQINGETISLSELCLPAEEIFNFNIELFKSFNTDVDYSDYL